MQRGAAAAVTPADTVARVVELTLAATTALMRVRTLRAHELFARALAAADAVLPRDSLVAAHLLYWMTNTHVMWKCGTGDPYDRAVRGGAAWHDDADVLLPWAQRCMNGLHARWRAGTLFTLTPEERAFCAGMGMPPLRAMGAESYICQATEALNLWPPARTAAEEEARVRGLHGALQLVLQLEARGYLRPGALLDATELKKGFLRTVAGVIGFSVARPELMQQMRALCGLSQADVMALTLLGARLQPPEEVTAWMQQAMAGELRDDDDLNDRAAADVARHGLRACALPECGAVEPQPKVFKLCSRCRGVVYCSAAHQQQDWRRHKRAEDGCKASAD
jgi:hypothetical protein